MSGWGVLRREAFRLPRHPASVGLARLRVRDHMAAWGHGPGGGTVTDTVLLVSELSTLLIHSGPLSEREFEIAVTVLADGSCFIEVSDESATGTGPWSASGLSLVESVARTWGVWCQGFHGRTVWALVGPRPPHPAAP